MKGRLGIFSEIKMLGLKLRRLNDRSDHPEIICSDSRKS